MIGRLPNLTSDFVLVSGLVRVQIFGEIDEMMIAETSKIEFGNSFNTLWCIIAQPQKEFRFSPISSRIEGGFCISVSIFPNAILGDKAWNKYIHA